MAQSRQCPVTEPIDARTLHAFRQYALLGHALCCLHGRGLVNSGYEAVRLLRLSLNKGCITAYYHLGLCYLKGSGVSVDIEEAATSSDGEMHPERNWKLFAC